MLFQLSQQPSQNSSGEKVNRYKFCKQYSHSSSPLSSSFFLAGMLSSKARFSLLLLILAHDAPSRRGRLWGLPTARHRAPTEERNDISSRKSPRASASAQPSELKPCPHPHPHAEAFRARLEAARLVPRERPVRPPGGTHSSAASVPHGRASSALPLRSWSRPGPTHSSSTPTSSSPA